MRSSQLLRVSTAAAAVTAALAAGTGLAGPAHAATLSWKTVSDYYETTDEAPGADLGQWYRSAYDGGTAEIVADPSETFHHDGALHLADGGSLQQVDGAYTATRGLTGYSFRASGPAFASFTGGYAVRQVEGPPARYSLEVGCNSDGSPGFVLTYADPIPATTGWQTIDVARDGRALWSTNAHVGNLRQQHPAHLAEYQSECPDGAITRHGFAATDGTSDSVVDAVVMSGTATDFVRGSGGADTLVGTSGVDVLRGYGGNDLIRGRGSNDYLLGDSGADELYGDRGSDTLKGGGGRDVLSPGRGADTVYGGAGRDTVVLTVDHDRDVIRCGSGFDTVRYRHGLDRRDHLVGCEKVR